MANVNDILQSRYLTKKKPHPPEEGVGAVVKYGMPSRLAAQATNQEYLSVVERNEFTLVPKEPSPYLVLGDVTNVELYNAVGLVGLMLTTDSYPCNMISGFNTLFALFEKYILTTIENRRYFKGYGYDVYSVVVNDFNDVCQSVYFYSHDTKTALLKLFQTQHVTFVNNLSSSKICTYVDYRSKLEKMYSLLYSTKYTIALCGTVYSIMFKMLIEENYDYWVNIIWIEVSKAAGVQCSLDKHILPSYDGYKAMYTTFSACFEIRREMFRTILKKADAPDSWGAVCRTICSFAKFTELEHIVYINKYILVVNPIVTTFPLLRDEFNVLFQAFYGILNANIEAADLPFLKILHRDEITEKLDPDNFPMLWYIADEFGFVSDPIYNLDTPQRISRNKVALNSKLYGIIHAVKNNKSQLPRENKNEHILTATKKISAAFTTNQPLPWMYVCKSLRSRFW